MKCRRRSLGWLALQLALGLAWVGVLVSRAVHDPVLGARPAQVAQMLLLAGWLPSLAVAVWQMQHRQWRSLLLSDLLAAGVLVALACTAYLPLFFFQVTWLIPLAVLPRGALAELVWRLLVQQRWRQRP